MWVRFEENKERSIEACAEGVLKIAQIEIILALRVSYDTNRMEYGGLVPGLSASYSAVGPEVVFVLALPPVELEFAALSHGGYSSPSSLF